MQNLLALLDSRKFIQVRRIIQEMNSVDLAELISEIEDEKDTVLLFRLLPKEMAAEVFSYLEHDQQQRVVEGLTDKELAGILDDLFMDDTVDFIDEMPASIVKRVIKIADPDTRRQINQLLMYPDSSAGSLMTTEFMEVDRDWEVGRAIREIRRQCEDKESVSYTHLVGTPSGGLAISRAQAGRAERGVRISPIPSARWVPPVRQNGTSAPTDAARESSRSRESGFPNRAFAPASTPAASAEAEPSPA